MLTRPKDRFSVLKQQVFVHQPFHPIYFQEIRWEGNIYLSFAQLQPELNSISTWQHIATYNFLAYERR